MQCKKMGKWAPIVWPVLVILNLIITNQSNFMPKRIVPKTPVGNLVACWLMSSHYSGNGCMYYIRSSLWLLTLIRFCGVRANPSQIKTVGISLQDMILCYNLRRLICKRDLVLRSAVGKTHDLRSDLWWTIPLHVLLDHFWDTLWIPTDQVSPSQTLRCPGACGSVKKCTMPSF